MDPELWELLEEGDSEDEIAAIVRLGQPNIVPKGVRLVAQFGDIGTVRMKREDILEVRAEEGVTSLKAAEPHGFGLAPDLELDRIEPAERVSEAEPWIYERRPPSLPETGCGVVVGVVDWGFDFAHADLRHEDGRTRILALWDQRPPPSPRSPQPYGYGIVHTTEDINRALAAEDPYGALGYHPADADIGGCTHGTHVASIAAGNGRGCGLTGVAPGADLVFVHLSTWGHSGLAKLGDSVTLLEAVHFIVRTADKRPWVINLSMGRHGEHHDGLTPAEQGLDAALRSAPGGCIVLSCGNYFHRRIHASGQLRPAEKRTLVWEIEDADMTPNKLEVWYEGRDVFDVEIRSPDGSISAHAALGERASLTADGRAIGTVYHRASEPNTLDNHIEIILYRGGPAGSWELTLIGKDLVDGRFHCWIERDSGCPPCQSRFRPEDAVPFYTTGTICNGLRTIAVGAYNPHSAERELAPFSSCGPTRDDRVKPDLIAPGESILAARSAPRDPRAEVPPWTLMSGTSMAAPHVAGAIACMFEAAERPLRIEETRNLLLANAGRVTGPEVVPDRVGSGYLDIARAAEAARRIGSAAPELQPSLHRNTEGDTVNRENDISSTGTWEQEPPQENGESNPLGNPDTVSFEAYGPAEPGTRDADEEWGSDTDDRPFEKEEDEEPALYENVEATEQELYETDVVSEQTSISSSASEIDGFGLVELADQGIAERAVARAPTQVLHDLLSRAGMAESLILPGNGRVLSAAELFDAFAYPGREALRDQLEQNFELVAPPRAPLDGMLREGDFVIRRGEAGLGHLSVIASPELRGYEELLSEGLIPEVIDSGKYAQVVETGARPHTLSDAFARRVVDATGRLPYDQLVLRLREDVRQRITESMQLGEGTGVALLEQGVAAERDYDTAQDQSQERCRRRWLAFWDGLPQPVKDALDKLDFKSAIAAAARRGLRDVTDLTNMLFYTKYGLVYGYCAIKKGAQIPGGGDRYDQLWEQLHSTFVLPIVGVPTPVIDLEKIKIDYQPETRLRYKSDGTFEGWFTKPVHVGQEPPALREIKLTGRVRIADAIARRNYDAKRDSKKWPLGRARVKAPARTRSADGPTSSSAGISRVKADGTFTTSTNVVFDGSPQRFSMVVTLELSRSTTLETSVELKLVEMDVARFIAFVDPKERARPQSQTHLEFLASVRKIYQGGSNDPLAGPFNLLLYRHRAVKELFAPDSAEAKWLNHHTVLYGDGELLDIGHVLTGIEGSPRQEPNKDQQAPGIPQRTETLVTWAGDLGSVFQYHIVEIVNAVAQGKQPDMKTYLANRTNRPDLIGDIDGINIGGSYDPTRSLAENLNAYYGKKSLRRFHEFLANTLDDNKQPALPLVPDTEPPKLSEKARAWIALRVSMYVRYHYAYRGLGKKVDPSKEPLVSEVIQPNSPQMKIVVDYFVAFLEEGLARES